MGGSYVASRRRQGGNGLSHPPAVTAVYRFFNPNAWVRTSQTRLRPTQLKGAASILRSRISSKTPERWAALAPVAGRSYPQWTRKVKDIPVSAFNGASRGGTCLGVRTPPAVFWPGVGGPFGYGLFSDCGFLTGDS